MSHPKVFLSDIGQLMALRSFDITLPVANGSKRRRDPTFSRLAAHQFFVFFKSLIVQLAVCNPGTVQSPPAQSLQPCSLVRYPAIVSAHLEALLSPWRLIFNISGQAQS